MAIVDEQNTTKYLEYFNNPTGKIDLEPLYKQVLAMSEQLFGSRPNELLACSLNHLAEFYESQQRLAEAEPLYERALAIREELLGCAHGLTHIYDRESGEVVPSSCLLSAAPYTIESIDGGTCLLVTPDYLWQCEYAIDYGGYATAEGKDIPDYSFDGYVESNLAIELWDS